MEQSFSCGIIHFRDVLFLASGYGSQLVNICSVSHLVEAILICFAVRANCLKNSDDRKGGSFHFYENLIKATAWKLKWEDPSGVHHATKT